MPFQPGQSGNPRGRPRKQPQASPVETPGPSPTSDCPVLERVAVKLTAIVDTDPDPDRVIRAGRLLASEEMRATIREMAAEPKRLAREADHQARLDAGVAHVLEQYPDVSPDQAERYIHACLALQAPRTLSDELRRQLGLWNPPDLDDTTLASLWRDLGLPGVPGPEPTPQPRPRPPQPDSALLAARQIERERQRRERVKPPELRSGPVELVEPESEQEEQRAIEDAEQARQMHEARLIDWPGGAIDPFGVV